MIEQSSPLVSVLMPAYNASKTIDFAIASLLAQTYKNWECIIVDDGSTDNTVEKVMSYNDERIKLYELGQNYGRGVARQKTLEMSNGVYITMLDADDWIYPNKLSIQVEYLEDHLDVALHSMSMAIADADSLIATRKPASHIERTLSDLKQVFIPHAPSMIRRTSIGDNKYDFSFKLAQDQDFLRRVLVNKKYFVSQDVGYCYSEIQSVNIKKIIKGYLYNTRGYLKLFKVFKLEALKTALLEMLKIPYTLFLYFAKGEGYVLSTRSISPTRCEIEDFNESILAVTKVFKALRGPD